MTALALLAIVVLMTSTLPAPKVITLPTTQPHINASRAAWIEHARILSTIVRRAGLRDVVEAPGETDLICARRSWSKEVGDRVCAAAVAGEFDRLDPRAWHDALGLPESVELTEDGSYVDVARWCSCPSVPGEAGEFWVRYERWTEIGRVAHGFVCADCRRLKQSG